jgi:hypothetical protein
MLPRTARKLHLGGAITAAVLAITGLTAGAAARPAPAAAAARTVAAHAAGTARLAVPDTSGKGPVGWATYRDLGALPTLPVGVETKQYSSFDRQQQNNDFRHTLRQLPNGGYVLAEHNGPGEIASIWTTSNGGDVTQTGNLHVVLDGKTILNAPEQDIVNGKLGAPFVYPLVANASQSSGGALITVPMTFRSSMLVWTDHDPVYYHVTYRNFADANGVSTFDPTDPAQDVITTLKAAGTKDPKPPLPGATTASKNFTLAPGQSETLASGTGTGPGEVTGLQLTLPQLTAPPQPTYVTDDGRAFGRDSNAYSQFTVKINPANQGVRLTRRLDGGVASQVADVYVDGVKAGTWAPNSSTQSCNWQNESIDLPASLTAGKSQITIKNVFVSSSNDFNEFYYWVDSSVNGSYQQTDAVDVGPNNTASETAHNYSISEQTWSGVRDFCYPPDSSNPVPVQQTDDILSSARVRISFDGQQTVDAPLGEFFGDGLGLYPVKSLMYGVNPGTKQFSAWWPMPYRSGYTVTLYNGSGETLSTGSSAVTSAPDAAAGAALGPAGQFGYFHATSNLSHTTQGADHTDLATTGWGKFVGVTSTNRGDPGYGRGYMEGNEHVYVDGAKTPQIIGTGTEDFYEGGWYFNNGPFSNPINGNPAQEDSTFIGCASDCIGAYRLMLADAVPFSNQISFGIEHGPTDNVPAVYGSTSYWYGRSQTAMKQTDSLTVGDASSEQAHGYSSPDPGPVQTLTSTYEGNDGPPAPVTATLRDTNSPVSFRLAVDAANRGVVLRRTSDQNPPAMAGVTDDGRAFGRDSNAYSQFTVNINPANQGVRLTRRLDAEIPSQVANVYVDGQLAAQWAPNGDLSGNGCHWMDESVDLPASLTAGKSQITIKNVFVSSANDFNEFYYWVDSNVNGSYQQTDAVDVGPNNTASETAHSYSISEQTFSGVRDFCYPPATSDAAYQTAEVYVNGQDAGQWQEPLSNPYHRWLDDIFQLPASLTAGKTTLSITLVPSAGSPPWSAANYTALSEMMP